MIHQCYFNQSQTDKLFHSPVYRGFGLYSAVNPSITKNCPELIEESNQPLLSEYCAMLHHWRNPELDTDPWIGFTSYRQLDKAPTILSDRSVIESITGQGQILTWYLVQLYEMQTRRPVSVLEQGEWNHPGITSCIWKLLWQKNYPFPASYSTECRGVFANYWVMSRKDFNSFMEWSYPLVKSCLDHKDDAFVSSHPRSIAYLVERLFICWYGLANKRVNLVGQPTSILCRNVYSQSVDATSALPVGRREFYPSCWYTSLVEVCSHYRLRPNGVIHIGAHYGEERYAYQQYGITQVLWIEADPEHIPTLRSNVEAIPGNKVYEACLSNKSGEIIDFFKTSNRGESSSLLQPKKHLEVHSEIKFTGKVSLKTQTFDEFIQVNSIDSSSYDYLTLDVQGAEKLVLEGMGDYLKNIKGIWVEVNTEELYEGCSLIDELDCFLQSRNFVRVQLFLTDKFYGDALYLNADLALHIQPDQEAILRIHQYVSLQRSFVVRSPGHRARGIELIQDVPPSVHNMYCSSGRISGATTPLEQKWTLRRVGHDMVLDFFGSRGRSATFMPFASQNRLNWKGRSLLFPNTQLELGVPNDSTPVFCNSSTSNLPIDLVIALMNKFGVKTFVETGTRHGHTAMLAAKYFDHVYTVEIDPETCNRLQPILAEYRNITLICNDSARAIHDICNSVPPPVIAWLDAHWSGGDTGKGTTECPVLDEVTALLKHSGMNIVLIDDARFFLSPPPPPHNASEWPTLQTIVSAARAERPDCFIMVADDAIIIGPGELEQIVKRN